MAQFVLQPVAFKPSAPVRNTEGYRNTVIEDAPQVSLKRAPPQMLQPKAFVLSPLSDDFPTPKANILATVAEEASPISSSSDSESDQSSLWSKRSSNSFDELYDISESESEEVHIKLSTSVKKRVVSKEEKSRYPSIVIPSPGQWPTIEKLKSASTLSPPIQVNLSPSVLSQLQQRSFRVPSSSSTPSLDGSLTSEELAASSCPSTPDLEEPADGENAWEPPVQLDRSAINLLHQISGEKHDDIQDSVIESPDQAREEMREILESPPVTGIFRIDTSCLAPSDPNDAEDELSALSIPSPGGFFASLDSTVAREAWTVNDNAPTTSTASEFYGVPFRSPHSSGLPTSTATSFYNLPWNSRPENPVEHVVSVASPTSTQAPITARKIIFSPTDVIHEVDEIDETYSDAIQQNASANVDRTQMWLSAQKAYMEAVCEDHQVCTDFEDVADAIPTTPEQTSPVSSEHSSPSKKSVRFNEKPAMPTIPETEASPVENKRISPIHDGTFWEAWRHTKRSQRARDVFEHRQARAEAEQVKRVSLQKQHTDQLTGQYAITNAERPSPQRPISSFLPMAAEDEKKEEIAQADRERQALEQLQSSSWHIDAQKEVNGGKLLTSPIVQSFKGRKDVRVLDLAGQAHCSWAWTVALEHPNAAIYTTVSSDAEAHVASLEGPSNHFVTTSPKLWELPFESKYFDVVSARNLYSHLKTIWPKGHAADEWDLTLRECLRVLKPGGYLEFDLLDAELVHADAATQALGVEFSFSLKTRGYDPCSGKNFLPRLKRAGFCEIKRAWMVLPVADAVPRWSDLGKPSGGVSATERSISVDGTVSEFQPPLTGSTKDVRAMTGLVGARMWEQWMIKLNNETGRSEKKVLHEVAKALEEGGKGQAGWRCLVGWARKAA
ncbi:methyltransferase domain-containing [Lecanosticta acicola]|uniref:Methyltransferase domain-containing n=1 Tax=Lecanosticta acicola TaxID=111012 RepID=A0AAI8Z3Z8_9PEZI|nr:methyltransferase domain-containing [Lecanosticta acicola]